VVDIVRGGSTPPVGTKNNINPLLIKGLTKSENLITLKV